MYENARFCYIVSSMNIQSEYANLSWILDFSLEKLRIESKTIASMQEQAFGHRYVEFFFLVPTHNL